jgi:hypothetical protein
MIKWIWKEAIVAYFKEPSQRSFGETKENVSQVRQPLDQNPNPGPPQYEAVVPTTQWKRSLYCITEGPRQMNFVVFLSNSRQMKSWDSSVGIATDYGLDDRMIWILIPAGIWNFSLRHRVQTASGAHPASGALSLGVKRPRRKADHSPPSSAEVKGCVELYLHSPSTSSWLGA